MTARVPPQLLGGLGAAGILLVGVLGLIPGALFHTSSAQDAIHLALGALGASALVSSAWARGYLTAAGTASLVLWLVGVVNAGGWLPGTPDDNWLHLLLGIGLLVLAAAPERVELRSPAAS